MSKQMYTHNKRIGSGYQTKVSLVGVLLLVFTVLFQQFALPSPPTSALAEIYQPAPATGQLQSTSPTNGVSSLESRIVSLFESFEQEAGTQVSLSFSALGTGVIAGVNQDTSIKSASLYKILAAYRVLERVDAGELILDAAISSCIEKAISESDNACGMQLQILANATDTDRLAQVNGYVGTTLSGVLPVTTASDQVAMVADIYTGKRLSNASQSILLSSLENQQITDRLPDYENAKSFHKTGDIAGAVNATTLVESTGGAYAISILTDDWDADLNYKYELIRQLHLDVHHEVTN